jgi:lipid-binding SYLF domain-containing protein
MGMRQMIRLSVVAVMMAVFTATCFIQSPMAEDTAKLNRDVDKALKKLYDSSPAAKQLSKNAKAVLVFPSILKVGLIFGGQYGEGELRKDGKTVGYYNTVTASYGLQAGAQKFGYALFFMDDASLAYLDNTAGWEIGVGPSVVFVDEGVAKTISTTTSQEGIYVFTFNQKGLMAGIGIQGSKITKIKQ